MTFIITFPYQFSNFLVVVPPIELSDEVFQEMVGHFDDVNDELECSGDITDQVYCLERFNLISVLIRQEIQTVELKFEGKGDRELLKEYLSLDSLFGGGQFLAARNVLITFNTT